MRYTFDKIPAKDRYTLDKYFDGAIPIPDTHFLYGLLTCNLLLVSDTATEEELLMLPTYVAYIRANGTRGSWGSKSAVEKWIRGYQ